MGRNKLNQTFINNNLCEGNKENIYYNIWVNKYHYNKIEDRFLDYKEIMEIYYERKPICIEIDMKKDTYQFNRSIIERMKYKNESLYTLDCINEEPNPLKPQEATNYTNINIINTPKGQNKNQMIKRRKLFHSLQQKKSRYRGVLYQK